MENNYYELYTFWITNIDKMFIENEEYDKLIKDKYESLLIKELECYKKKIKKEINDKVILVSKIILCDQISRHIFRHSKKEIKKYDEIALSLFENNKILTKIEDYLPIDRLLLLMPYRHTFNYQKINICLKYVKEWLKNTENKEEIQLYERFIKASLKTILKKHNEPILLNIENFRHSEMSINKDIYDTSSIKYTDRIKEINTEHKYVKQFYESMREININNKKLVVSLSAGIDSNVLLFLLHSYLKKYQIPCELRCLIMYYKNRSSQYEEIKIAQNLCSHLNIHLYIRTVEEVQRNTLSDRSYYEEYTKEIKYDCYNKIGEYIFLLTIGWCLGIAELAEVIGLSKEIGAFIAGISLATSPIAQYIALNLKPLRDFFLILFFFSLGGGFDLSLLATIAVPAIILAIAMLSLKPIIYRYLLRSQSENNSLSWDLGFRLGQNSEFSLLIAYMAFSTSLIGNDASHLIQATAIITFLVSSYIVVFNFPSPIAVSDKLRRD